MNGTGIEANCSTSSAIERKAEPPLRSEPSQTGPPSLEECTKNTPDAAEVIDVTSDVRPRKKRKKTQNGRRPAKPSSSSPVQAANLVQAPSIHFVERFDEDLGVQAEDAEAERERACVFLGAFSTKIVGVQYYNGTVSRREQVKLLREPHNTYDRNAVRVDNIQNIMVGHLPKAIVAHLAPILDNGMVHHAAGVVTRGNNNPFSIPVTIFLYGLPGHKQGVVERCRYGGIYLGVADKIATKVMELEPVTKTMDPTERQDALDQLFARLDEERRTIKTVTPSPVITSPLYPHQKEALAWMMERENNNTLPPFWTYDKLMYENILSSFRTSNRPEVCRGGILADDMGLGKTLETIALIATNRPGVPIPVIQEMSRPANSTAVSACQAQKKRSNKRGKGKVPKIVATTQDEQASTSSPPAAAGPKATLIVCPLSVMFTWEQQIAEHIDGSLSVYRYHGDRQTPDAGAVAGHDVVITTYGTMAQDRFGVLKTVKWLRVVLDEAHNIKNPCALQSQAARSLKAERRWCLTGTPIQNKLSDLFSLVWFLRLLDDRAFWTRTFDKPVQRGDPRGLDRLVTLMAAAALRRTKDQRLGDGSPLVSLPSKQVLVQMVELSIEDRARYSSLLRAAQESIGGMMVNGSIFGNYSYALEVILRLRQLCCHDSLVPRARDGGEQPANPPAGEQFAHLLRVLKAGGADDCCICLGAMFHPVVTRCGHVFCRGCIVSSLERRPSCPLCRADCSLGSLVEAPPEEEQEEEEKEEGRQASADAVPMSAKLEALVARLRADLRPPADGERKTKAVVFSQFVSFIAIAQKAAQHAGFKCVSLTGGLQASVRQKRIQDFQSHEHDSPDVIFVSLRAGGVGINLTAASKVYLLDPWWNPGAEDQAMDRVHRLGQTRAVTVVKFAAKDTIEERMLELQRRKRELAKAVFERKTENERQQMRIAELSLLLSIGSL